MAERWWRTAPATEPHRIGDYSLTQPPARMITHSLTHSLTHLLTCSLTHSLTYSLAHLHTLPHLLTHILSLTNSPTRLPCAECCCEPITGKIDWRLAIEHGLTGAAWDALRVSDTWQPSQHWLRTASGWPPCRRHGVRGRCELLAYSQHVCGGR